MLTLQETDRSTVVSVSTYDKSVEELLNKEWLLTNNRGGYSSSTIIGCNTRRYHGLLVGSLHPPVDRIMALSNCLEMLILNGKVFNLSTFEFPDKFSPEGFGYIKQFRRDIGVHFDYQLNKLEMTKSLYLCRESDTITVVYDFTHVEEAIEFVLRPFVSLRDFHSLQKSYAHICRSHLDNGLVIRHDTPGSCELFLNCPSMNFEKDKQWWFNFLYRCDKIASCVLSLLAFDKAFFVWALDTNEYRLETGLHHEIEEFGIIDDIEGGLGRKGGSE